MLSRKLQLCFGLAVTLIPHLLAGVVCTIELPLQSTALKIVDIASHITRTSHITNNLQPRI